MYGQAAIGAGIDHGTDAAILVTGDGCQIDLDQRTTNSGIPQTTADVVAFFDIAELKTVAVLVQVVQGVVQGDFRFRVVGAVVEHSHRFLTVGKRVQRLHPCGLQRFCLQGRFQTLAVFILH